MSSPTPGPWVVDGRDKDGFDSVMQDSSPRDDFFASVYSGDENVQAANARLIAAAPDLLAACEDFKRELQEWCASNTPPTDSTMAELMQRVSAAIAKAKAQ